MFSHLLLLKPKALFWIDNRSVHFIFQLTPHSFGGVALLELKQLEPFNYDIIFATTVPYLSQLFCGINKEYIISHGTFAYIFNRYFATHTSVIAAASYDNTFFQRWQP